MKRNKGKRKKGWGKKCRRALYLLAHLPDDVDLVGVEIGVNKGETTAYLLANRPRLSISLVDPYVAYALTPMHGVERVATQEQKDRHRAAAMARMEPYGDRAVFIRKPSAMACGMFEDESLDFAFVDGDHTYEAARDDIRAWFGKVKPGGILFVHDYETRFEGVVKAFNEFIGELPWPCHNEPGTSVVSIRKGTV